MRDVRRGHTTRVERTHRQLRTRFTDGLSGHDTDRGSELHELVIGEVVSVALLTETARKFALEHRAHDGRFDFVLHEITHMIFVDQRAFFHERLFGFGVLQIFYEEATEQARENRFADFVALFRRERHALGVTTVFRLDDHVLRNVHETAREISGVRRTQRGVGQPLTRSVRCDEVFKHVESLRKRGFDR